MASPGGVARSSLPALAAALIAVGCQRVDPSPSYAEPSVPSTTVPFAAGFLDGIAWLGDGRIVFGYRAPEDEIGGETHLWSVRPDGSGAGPVEIDTGARCTSIGNTGPARPCRRTIVLPAPLCAGQPRSVQREDVAPGRRRERSLDTTDAVDRRAIHPAAGCIRSRQQRRAPGGWKRDLRGHRARR